MADEWRDVALEDVAEELTVGHVGPMASEYVDKGIPMLRSMNVDPLRINTKDLKFITPEFHSRIKKSRLTPGDVVIVRTGKPGACSVIPDWLTDANCSDLVIVRCGKELNNHFLAYYVNTVASDHVAAHLVGAVQQHFNVGSARTLRLKLPPLAEQRAIASVLGALDDKIELNRRMNATLESMARALFQSWFVDFDPVRAKLDGRQPVGMDAATAALFPDSFEHCDAELIPRGWRMVPIAEIADINYGKNLPATELRQSGFPVYGAAGVVGFYSTSMFEEPVTLVTSRGSGSGTVHQTYEPAFITNNSFTVVPRSECLGRHYLRFSLLNADIVSLVTGSAQPQLTITNFSYLKLLEPSKDVAVAFHKVVDQLWIKAAANDRESRTLATLRDTLLPKLLSGELRMADVIFDDLETSSCQ